MYPLQLDQWSRDWHTTLSLSAQQSDSRKLELSSARLLPTTSAHPPTIKEPQLNLSTDTYSRSENPSYCGRSPSRAPVAMIICGLCLISPIVNHSLSSYKPKNNAPAALLKPCTEKSPPIYPSAVIPQVPIPSQLGVSYSPLHVDNRLA